MVNNQKEFVFKLELFIIILFHFISFHFIFNTAITTNGVTLNSMLDNLITAGLNSVNISLDTLNEAKYAKITRREGNIFRKVLAVIYRLKYVIYPLN